MPSCFKHSRSRAKPSDRSEDLFDNGPITNTTVCHACTQVGVPAFHSTQCDHANQPEWEASAGSSLIPICDQSGSKINSNRSSNDRLKPRSLRFLNRIYDPRSQGVRKWNKFFLLARGMALVIDPLFVHTISIRGGSAPCLYMDGALAVVLAVLRTLVDSIHLVYMLLQFRMAYVSRESLVVGRGKLVWDPRSICSHYVRSLKRFWYDAFVILPIPQVAFWLLVPRLIQEERVQAIMTTLLAIFAFQFLPKVCHSVSLIRRMAKVTGYFFGTISLGFTLNLIAYLIASHVMGGCWYALAIHRVVLCLTKQCNEQNTCNLAFSCGSEVCYQFLSHEGTFGDRCTGNSTTNFDGKLCLDMDSSYNFGIYGMALPVISSKSRTFKILYTIVWGLFSLGTFGNDLEPTSNLFEVMFSICVVLSGLLLFILLIGNIQVFLEDAMQEKSKMELERRDMEWWMRRRQLPSHLKQRVRHYACQSWAMMGGEDEMELIKHLPEGLRYDIKHFLCLELIQMVPLFHNLGKLILDNICDRVKPLLFIKNEKIIREGDPVHRMVFIVQGRVKASQNLSKGVVATSILSPGDYLGDELLSWCLRRPFINRLPTSSATFTCIEPIEAFGIDANCLHYVTSHFRYIFVDEKLKRTIRYYSSNWRTWAAVNIQIAWRRYVMRMRRKLIDMTEDSGSNHMLRQYAAIFMSITPHDHLRESVDYV